jgi:hypothetical protein
MEPLIQTGTRPARPSRVRACLCECLRDASLGAGRGLLLVLDELDQIARFAVGELLADDPEREFRLRSRQSQALGRVGSAPGALVRRKASSRHLSMVGRPHREIERVVLRLRPST